MTQSQGLTSHKLMPELLHFYPLPKLSQECWQILTENRNDNGLIGSLALLANLPVLLIMILAPNDA